MSLLGGMMSWFNAAAAGNLAVAVIYQRGATQVPWSATVSETNWEGESDESTVEGWTSRDYSGDPAVLVNGGITMPPVEGDKVVEVISGKTVTHGLMRGPSGQEYQFDDTNELRVRVFTKELSRV